jgi:hypothetical protein
MGISSFQTQNRSASNRPIGRPNRERLLRVCFVVLCQGLMEQQQLVLAEN